jgi:hypothetical protein
VSGSQEKSGLILIYALGNKIFSYITAFNPLFTFIRKTIFKFMGYGLGYGV